MTKAKNLEITTTYMLVPMCLMALTMVFFFVFQSTQVMKERDDLSRFSTSLTTPFEDGQKVNQQFGGLVLGTQKLAKEGTGSAKDLVARLIQIGVLPDPSKQATQAPVPVAQEGAPKGPVKP